MGYVDIVRKLTNGAGNEVVLVFVTVAFCAFTAAVVFDHFLLTVVGWLCV
jgi:hypothetical protein